MARPSRRHPPQLAEFFVILSRDKVVDFNWNTEDPWTIVSVSNDCERTGGRGTLHIWRMNDLIYGPEGEVLSELNSFKDHILSCAPLRT